MNNLYLLFTLINLLPLNSFATTLPGRSESYNHATFYQDSIRPKSQTFKPVLKPKSVQAKSAGMKSTSRPDSVSRPSMGMGGKSAIQRTGVQPKTTSSTRISQSRAARSRGFMATSSFQARHFQHKGALAKPSLQAGALPSQSTLAAQNTPFHAKNRRATVAVHHPSATRKSSAGIKRNNLTTKPSINQAPRGSAGSISTLAFQTKPKPANQTRQQEEFTSTSTSGARFGVVSTGEGEQVMALQSAKPAGPTSSAPLDGGLSVLLAAGAAVGIRKAYQRRKKASADDE